MPSKSNSEIIFWYAQETENICMINFNVEYSNQRPVILQDALFGFYYLFHKCVLLAFFFGTTPGVYYCPKSHRMLPPLILMVRDVRLSKRAKFMNEPYLPPKTNCSSRSIIWTRQNASIPTLSIF